MFTLNSKYGDVTVFAETIEQEAISQILNMANSPIGENAHMCIMPDCHAGKGCTVGTTMKITDKVCANTVGVDIGCGMSVYKLNIVGENRDETTMSRFFADFDRTVNTYVPSGMTVNEKLSKSSRGFEVKLRELYCCSRLKEVGYLLRSIGTLGGGNHFIELNKNSDGEYLLVIHSGSRHLSKEVATLYQREAERHMNGQQKERSELVSKYRAEGRETEIEDALKSLNPAYVPKELAYCEGELFDRYIHDMKIAQEYAELNRRTIAEEIEKNFQSSDGLRIELAHYFTTFHNYIDTDNMILRKGAVSAQEGELLIIPINMRDGSLICRGKGNPDWNFSAPHGAGRLMSRSMAKERITLEEYAKSMEGIYTTSVGSSTIDESPQAYKPMEEIIRCIRDTVEIVDIIKPVYNFKAH